MSATTLVCTTRSGAQPLMPGGEKLYARQTQIRTVLERRLGDAHAHLLAEPQARTGDDRTAWLSPTPGIVRPLAALPSAVRDSVRAECDALLAGIERLGATLETGASGDSQLAGRLLRVAARRPSDDHLFLVGNQPVLVCWGCAHADAGVVLTRTPASAPHEEVEASAGTNPGARWLIPGAQAMPVEICVPSRSAAMP